MPDKTEEKQAADSRNWGMAKTFAMQALNEGVDLSDPIQNEKFIRQLNQNLKRTNNITINKQEWP